MTNAPIAATVMLFSVLSTNWQTTQTLKPEGTNAPLPNVVVEEGTVVRKHWVQFPEGASYMIRSELVTNLGVRFKTNAVVHDVVAFTNLSNGVYWYLPSTITTNSWR